MTTNLFDNNFKLFNMFFTNFNSSVEFAICWEIPSSEGFYHMEFSPPICNINLLTGFCMIGDFSEGYSQTDCNFNFNINVTVGIDMNSSFNFSFSHLIKYLLAFRIMKLESTSKIMKQFEIILFIFDKQAWHESYIFFNCSYLPLLTHRFVFH